MTGVERVVPRIFDIVGGEAEAVKETPYGNVGLVYAGAGIRAEWVSKRGEAVDPGWFSQDVVDLICVVQGELREEYERADISTQTVRAGQVLILPPGVRCRAYRWPREAQETTVFLAVYPVVDRSTVG